MDPGSFLARWWTSIKPLPEEASRRAPVTAQKRKQRRLIKRTIGVVTLAGTAWYVYGYIASAPERANAQLQAGMQKMQPRAYREAIAPVDRAGGIMPQLAERYPDRRTPHPFTGRIHQAPA